MATRRTTGERGLLDWLGDPDPDRGIKVLGSDRTWHEHSYPEVAAMVFDAAARLRADGVRPGDVVTVALGSRVEFVAGFFGALTAGATPSPIAPPLVFQDPAAYDRHAEGILRTARPRAVLTSGTFAQRLRSSGLDRLAGSLTVLPRDGLGSGTADPTIDPPADHAIVQFTSGSSGPPKGVAVPWSALEANVAAIRRWLGMGPDDPTATWLPVHHDMGLIGCLVTPVVNGSDIWMMQPEDFIRSPGRWLGCFGEHGARLTALPNFGLEHVVRRVRPDSLAGLDFSEWRAAILGAERIEAASLRRFHDLLAPHGFSSRAFLPAYGLAEATLAVTGVPVGRGYRSVVVDRRSLVHGGAVELLEDDGPDAGEAVSLVGCGPALGAGEIRILDRDGQEAAPGCLGDIVVTSDSVAAGYLTEDGLAAKGRFDGRSLLTGDAGFVIAGELYVVGRLGDSIKRRARTIFAEDIEGHLVSEGKLRKGRAVVLLGALDGDDCAVLVAEGSSGAWVDETVRAVRRLTENMPVIVTVGSRGTVHRTSSGKPRRRPMWEAFVDGTLGVEVVYDSRSAASASS